MALKISRRFLKCRRGTTAIEFGLVAIPFFTLLFAILETSIIYFATITLENGLYEASRQIRTGELQSGANTMQAFKDAVCAEVDSMLSCGGKLSVDVRAFNSFGGASAPNPIVNGELAPNMQFSPGAPGDIVLVRAFYTWQLRTPIFGEIMANLTGQRRLLAASVAFRNEPFGAVLPNGG